MSKKIATNRDYIGFFNSVKKRVHAAQYEALKAVNKELISLYWDIGKMIREKQEELGWGKSVVEQLSKDLQSEFPGVIGFSPQNLWYMRQFYMEYHKNKKLQPLVGEISWTKNVLIFGKCKDSNEREFYIRSTKKFGWTKDVLTNQIENKTYEKYLLNQSSFDNTLPEKYKYQAKLAVKDHYTFDFLEMSEYHSEKELERSLVENIQRFLTEMGSYFTFIGTQYRLTVSNKDYFVDLLLFHRQLKCLVAIDLKIGEFKPEYKGKMEFYLSVLNDTMKLAEENDSIGIIICKSKNKTIVEYSLKNATQPIGVATYSTTNKLPSDYKKYLPGTEEIKKRLADFNYMEEIR